VSIPNRIQELYKPFSEPWHAELFAITIYLNEQGYFLYSDWIAGLSDQLVQEREDCLLEDGNDYYIVWFNALISLLEKRGITNFNTIDLVEQRWVHAYEHTPHGDPVKLD
jgi:nitrile hydratase accessory protein